MRHAGRNVEDLAAPDDDLLRLIFADSEFQCALEDVRELLVVVGMQRYNASLVQIYLCQHTFFTGHDPSAESLLQLLSGHVFPPKMPYGCFTHIGFLVRVT